MSANGCKDEEVDCKRDRGICGDKLRRDKCKLSCNLCTMELRAESSK